MFCCTSLIYYVATMHLKDINRYYPPIYISHLFVIMRDYCIANNYNVHFYAVHYILLFYGVKQLEKNRPFSRPILAMVSGMGFCIVGA